jgi:hypothetical protein
MFLIAMIFGGLTAHFADSTHAYCECKRDNFKGAYCQTFKQGESDSCHK